MAETRGKKASAKKAALGTPTTDDDFDSLIAILQAPTNATALAISGAALVELYLERIIRPRFTGCDNSSWNELTGDKGPLNTFHQKIEVAYGLGCISLLIRKNLKVLKSIRNKFAHPKRYTTFGTPGIESLLATVVLPSGQRTRLYKDLRKVKASGETKGRFIALVYVLASHLIRLERRRSKERTRHWTKKAARAFTQSAVKAGRGIFGGTGIV